MPTTIIAKSSYDYRFVRDGTRVLIMRDGECVADWPYEFVLNAAIPTLREQAKRAEEIDKAEAIARDSAIMLRAGAPFILSDRRDIAEEAKKLAEHDRQIRQMPYIKSREKFGHPVIEVLPPKKPEHVP